MKQIREFTQEHEFLSNDYPVSLDVLIDKSVETYPCVSNAYYAIQFPGWVYRMVMGHAKSLSHAKLLFYRTPEEFRRKISPEQKIENLESLLLQKFSLSKKGETGAVEENPLALSLLDTGYSELINGSFEVDEETEFLGNNLNTGKGKNHLGRLLMHIRCELRKQKSTCSFNDKLVKALQKYNLPLDLIKFEDIE